MNTRQVILYVAVVAGSVILLCAGIAILKSICACFGHGRKPRRARRHTPPVITRHTTAHHSPGAQHHAPYTISVAPQLQPNQYHYYGATHPNVPPYGVPASYPQPVGQWYGSGGPAMSSGVAATAPPPYTEAVNNEAYKQQEAYNPGYQHA